jgi:hypothetical protein
MFKNLRKFIRELVCDKNTQGAGTPPPPSLPWWPNPRYISVYIEDGVGTEFVRRSLQYVPGYWEFGLTGERPPCYTFLGDKNWEGFPIPLAAGEIVIFDGEACNAKYGGGCVGESAGIARFNHDTDEYRFGLRIWHELLHASHVDADAMLRSPGFDQWLEPSIREEFIANKPKYGHSPQYQTLFYSYLMQSL